MGCIAIDSLLLSNADDSAWILLCQNCELTSYGYVALILLF